MSLQIVSNFWSVQNNLIIEANKPYFIGNFTSPFIVVNVTSEFALDSWKKAGNLAQAIAFGNNIAYGEFKEITLNTFLLFQFPILTGNDYKLYYFPLKRLEKISLTIWEYQGETIDESLKKIAEVIKNSTFLTVDFPGIQPDLNEIKTNLNIIKSLLNNQPKKIEPTSEQITFFLFN